ncbi:amidohydrolase/deacetylase family metallohydrolase [Micromonospora sp. U21]|uniref:amidohydrolase/deacetylase family metallohydrolase n=1 Tax=Micromonospora sp. U21 TaxID=2824899 RepID=UPI001B35C86A|nr:amidohydrolase/deacetylase family metallohydrolase [Micromonospora sp. U21]MBQ0905989.1 amidohydrolase/deacetylase family metallohydrolase [Micromonospora sp. U21]
MKLNSWRRKAALAASVILPMGLVGAGQVTQASATPIQQPGTAGTAAEPRYDLILDNGHVIDPKNNIDGVRDIAVRDGRIVAVAKSLNPKDAEQVVNARGKYVTPGIIDMHAHMFVGPANDYAAGWNSVAPDGFTFRAGVTTAVDTGSAGWENFEEFKTNVIDRSKTRVLSFLNIVGKGMAGGEREQDLENMQAGPAAEVALQNPDHIVGIKTAHYSGPEWDPVRRSVQAGEIADVPVMVDFGLDSEQRTIEQLLTQELRPGDVYTHVYSGLRRELGDDGRLNPALHAGRERGIVYDVGHGGGSFSWDVAVQGMKEDLPPDTISTDLHITSMNSGMKDMANVMSKMVTLGMSLEDVVKASTLTPAQVIQRPDLGHLSVGAPADVAVFSLDRGRFGFVDSFGFRLDGKEKLTAELTLREGNVVWDLNGIAATEWKPGRDRD